MLVTISQGDERELLIVNGQLLIGGESKFSCVYPFKGSKLLKGFSIEKILILTGFRNPSGFNVEKNETLLKRLVFFKYLLQVAKEMKENY